jgi:transposase
MKVQKNGYEGKKVFLGIDVHKNKYVIAATCEGVGVKKWTQVACPNDLVRQINKFFPKAVLFSAYEAGFSGYTLHRTLKSSGVNNIVVNPGSIETKSNDRVKTDKRDARKISEQLSTGRLKGIYVPSPEEEAKRAITRGREQVVSRRKRISNQIKMKLHYLGIRVSERQSITVAFLKSIQELDLPEEHKFVFTELTKAWFAENESLKAFNKALAEQAKDDRLERVYRSAPGIGVVSARTLSNEFGDMTRFNNEKELFSCTGLTPSEHSSGEHIRKGHISRQGIPRIRGLLVEVAWRAVKESAELDQYFRHLLVRRGSKRAIVAVARKILGRIRKCLKENVLWLNMEVNY